MGVESEFKPDILKGKVLLISGGGTGIGFGICRVFGAHGAKIAMGGRRKNVLDEACAKLKEEGIEAIGIQCDVRDPDSCINFANKAREAFGRVDVLINNAAGNFSTPIENLTPNGFKTVMDIDLHGSFNMAKAALPHLKDAGEGLIINISATLYYKAFPFQMHASAAKAAIDVMMQNIGVEWGVDHNIRCVSVAPGPIEDTVGGPGGRVFGKMVDMTGGSVKALVPLGRYGTVQDIGNTCLFLASKAGSYINATTIVVDGGNWHQASGHYMIAKSAIKKASSQEKQTHKGGAQKSKL